MTYEELRDALVKLTGDNQPATVRQIYYLATVAGVVPKTEAGYGLVQRQLVMLRERGRIPWDWIRDNTRRVIEPQTYGSAEQALNETAQFYRKNYWQRQPKHVEIWLEKDALAGVITPITLHYQVPLHVMRGYASVTFLHASAQELAAVGKPCEVLLLGDCDPSGVGARQEVMRRIREFAPHAEIHFSTIALSQKQAKKWNLPTRPTKKSDLRSVNWVGDSVELDAIPPPRLRELVENAIHRRIDWNWWKMMRAAEESEKGILSALRLA